ncbi:MAG: phosphatidylglycerol:prolipoprotein diacylglycerol transferase [Desulforhopalus sp.]|jgi:phosphatidylglycerol:prolipoprotein diacylglycerol transferase
MLSFPEIDPIIFSLGPLHVRWYGLMYVIGFMASYSLVLKQIKEFDFQPLARHFENLNLVLIVSVILGGRLGYVVFYNLPYYLKHPLEIAATWNGGMSFHGACIALLIGGWFYCKKHGVNFWKTADIYVATAPIGLCLGRIGNFINGELYGRVTDSPLGMIFPGGGPNPRHPSQLYEAFLEGFVLFILLWGLRKYPWKNKPYWPHGSICALFFICYGILRVIVENFREPDLHIGFIYKSLTMGQLLSAVMITAGSIMWLFCYKKATKKPNS